MDEESGLCLGCFRTLDEIAGWARMNPLVRDVVMTQLPGRRGRIRPEKLGFTG